MDVSHYIRTYQDIIPLETLSSLIKWANTQNFNPAGILKKGQNNFLDENVRKVKALNLNVNSESLTNAHYFNLLGRTFTNYIQRYFKDTVNDPHAGITELIDISILKYEDKGFYTWHTDHHASIPRTISLIYFCNNDYEGGELCFANEKMEEIISLPKIANSLVIWPSNFIFPHRVNPVTKGIRYSVVCWGV